MTEDKQPKQLWQATYIYRLLEWQSTDLRWQQLMLTLPAAITWQSTDLRRQH